MSHLEQINNAISRAINRIRQPFRAVVNLVKNGPANQSVQVSALAGETLPGVELMQHFGFSSNPPPGTPAVILPLGGKTAHGIIIATEGGQYRIKPLEEGEAVIYNVRGDYVVLRKSGVAEIHCDQLLINAPGGVNINAPLVDISGNLHAAEVADQHGAKSMSGMRNVHNDHTHKDKGGGIPNQSM